MTRLNGDRTNAKQVRDFVGTRYYTLDRVLFIYRFFSFPINSDFYFSWCPQCEK